MRRLIFLILPDLEILDLAGPLQVFTEANAHGADYDIQLCGSTPRVSTHQQLSLGELKPLVALAAGDLVIIPGIRFASLRGISSDLLSWLRQGYSRGADFCSICTGAFVLGQAGLLDGRQCTTHWNRVDDLGRQFPRARVLSNRLFVEDGRITTSAGIAAGIDLALALVERQHGPRMTALVAREMVVYHRRDGSHQQDSVYLDYRVHLHSGIHRVQDLLSSEPEQKRSIRELARVANMSERNLTRVFRKTAGISIGEYINKLRMELAKSLTANTELGLEAIAERCGFESARQFRRTWKKAFGVSPSHFRKFSSSQ